MAHDPGFANDTCIFMEAISGDGGTHNSNDVWWLSPDINLRGPVSGPDSADAGQINLVQVKFHKRDASSNCHFPGDESITVQLWVANPSLMMSPLIIGSAARVGFIGSQIPPDGGSHTQQIDWDVPASPPLNDPQSPGLKCLVARCYPESLAPSNTNFFVPGDQHVAQHNLCVVTVSATGGQALKFKINTVTPAQLPGLLQPARVKLRAVLDLAPGRFVDRTVRKRLETLSDFQRIRTSPLTFGFKFDLSGFQVSQVIDHSHPPLVPPHTDPSFEALAALDASHVNRLSFLASLKGTQPGEACIFHLIQTSANNVAEGGLTLVTLTI